jgi:hypothetical protein
VHLEIYGSDRTGHMLCTLFRGPENLNLVLVEAGLADDDARVIGEALAGYLYGWCSRDAHLEARVSQAQAALNLGAGGSGDHVMQQRPTGTALPVVAVARMVAGVLGLELEAR